MHFHVKHALGGILAGILLVGSGDASRCRPSPPSKIYELSSSTLATTAASASHGGPGSETSVSSESYDNIITSIAHTDVLYPTAASETLSEVITSSQSVDVDDESTGIDNSEGVAPTSSADSFSSSQMSEVSSSEYTLSNSESDSPTSIPSATFSSFSEEPAITSSSDVSISSVTDDAFTSMSSFPSFTSSDVFEMSSEVVSEASSVVSSALPSEISSEVSSEIPSAIPSEVSSDIVPEVSSVISSDVPSPTTDDLPPIVTNFSLRARVVGGGALDGNPVMVRSGYILHLNPPASIAGGYTVGRFALEEETGFLEASNINHVIRQGSNSGVYAVLRAATTFFPIRCNTPVRVGQVLQCESTFGGSAIFLISPNGQITMPVNGSPVAGQSVVEFVAEAIIE